MQLRDSVSISDKIGVKDKVKYNFTDSKPRLDNIVSKWYFIFTHDMSRYDISSVNMTRKEMPYKAVPCQDTICHT